MPKKRKKARKNPAPKRRRRSAVRKTAKRAAKRMTAGLNFKTAIKNMIPIQIGMFSAKWLAKRFGDGASETDPASWGMWDYIKGAAGSGAAAMVINMIKPGWGQKVLEGGMNLMAYKAIQNELVAPNPWANEQFGEDEDYIPDEYLMTGYSGADDEWGYAQDGTPIPLDDRHRMPVAGYGDELAPPGRLGGDNSLYPLGPMGESDDEFARAYSLQ